MRQALVVAGNLSLSDPFRTLGVQRSHKIDPSVLEKALIKASMQWHPDRWIRESKDKQEQAEHNMATINAAFKKLQDRLHRAEALMQHYGQHLPEGTDKDSSPEMLFEMMELKEEAESIKSDGKRARLFSEKLSSMENIVLDEIEKFFDGIISKELKKLGPKTIQTLKIKLNRAFYLRRTREDIEQKNFN